MRVNLSSDELASIGEEIQSRLAGIPSLADLSIDVELLESFDDLPEAEFSEAYRNTPAAYRRSAGKVLVNKARFPLERTSSASALAILAHEIAHAYLHRGGSVHEELHGWGLGEDEKVDFLLCEWGLIAELKSERGASDSYGTQYCDALDCWRDPKEYCERMSMFRMKKLSGR
jgi:hypothetical protein